MASITWSGNFGGNSAGSGGRTTSISASSSLPATAVITSISYSISLTASKYSSRKNWNLYWLIAQNSSGTIGAYIGSGGNSSVVASTSMSSTSGTISGSLSLSDQSVFQSTSIQCYAKANTNHSATSYMRAVSVTVNYVVPYLSWGGTLSAYQSNNQVVLNWSATPSYGNGTGACTYSVHNGTSWVKYDLAVSTRSYTLTPTSYGGNITYKVAALYHGGLLYEEKTVTFAAKPPSLSWNNAVPMVTENADGTLTISWNAGSGSWGAAGTVVKYTLYAASSSTSSGTAVGTYTSTSATIAAPAKDTYYYVTAVYGSASSTSGRTVYAAHRTVKRWNGSAWEECIVYCYQNGTWVECIPYIYNGSGWSLLSH